MLKIIIRLTVSNIVYMYVSCTLEYPSGTKYIGGI